MLNPQKSIDRKSKTVGHIMKNEKIYKNKPNFFNTCAFDALFACFCAIDSDKNQPLNFGENTETILLIDHLNKNGFDKKANDLKETILKKIFLIKTDQFSSINCENNITFFIEQLNCESYEIEKNCICKNIVHKNPFIYLDVSSNKDLNYKLNNVLSIINPKIKKNCSKGHVYDCNVKLNNILFFQITFFNEFNTYDMVSNKYIPREIVISNESFILKSIVNYKAPKIRNAIGHYQAYCIRTAGYEVYDNSSSKIIKNNNHHIIPHLLIYVKKQFSY